MTRFFSVIAVSLALVCGIAYAQTYVRPSKGNPIKAFTDTGLDGGWAMPTASGVQVIGLGIGYDFSAFSGAEVAVFTDGVGQNYAGAACSTLSIGYQVTETGYYFRLERLRVASTSTWFLRAGTSPTYSGSPLSGNWRLLNSPNASVEITQFKGCNVIIMMTPIPFPSIPNTFQSDGGSALVVYDSNASGGSGGGGGSSGSATATFTDAGVSVTVPYCTASAFQTKTIGTSSITFGQLVPGRWLARICNSCRNTGVPMITCTDDGTTPTTAATFDGEVLGVCDCVTYTNGSNAIKCISDTATTYVTQYECK